MMSCGQINAPCVFLIIEVCLSHVSYLCILFASVMLISDDLCSLPSFIVAAVTNMKVAELLQERERE